MLSGCRHPYLNMLVALSGTLLVVYLICAAEHDEIYGSQDPCMLHVILVGVMGTIYKDHTDQPLADLHLDCHKIKKLTHKLNEHSIRHASTLIKSRYAPQYDLNNNSQGAGLGATAHKPPDPH